MPLSSRGSSMQAGEDSGSFWESGNYRCVAQRIPEGQRLCKDLVALLKDRANVEKAYAKELHAWAKRGRQLLQGGPEYGTTKALWEGILTEGEKLGDLHLQIKDKLCNDVIKQVETWSKESYHKSKSQIKEKKEMEEAFKNAQKPWEKLMHNVEDAKIEYHTAFRTERSAVNQLRNAYGDPDLPLSQVKKVKDRSEQCTENLRTAKEKYVAVLREVHSYKPKYIDDMTAVFDKSQEMEWERLQFFKQIMFSVQKCFDVSQNPTFQQIYEEFYATIDNTHPEKELQWWLQNHGPHMDMKCPTFEEYQEGMREIVKRKLNTEVAPGTNLTNWRILDEDSHESDLSSKISARDTTDSSNKKTSEVMKNIKPSTSPIVTFLRRTTHPFDEDESDNETGESFVECGDVGIQVKALKDYEAKSVDELNFKEGDVFEKLDEADEQGWCRGRKDGRVGLYPASYVEIVQQ